MNDPKYNPGQPPFGGQPFSDQPFPGQPGGAPGGERLSSIERAVRAFDRQEFVPPSSPGDMLPHALNPAGQGGAYGAGAPQGGAGQVPFGQPTFGQPTFGQPPMGAPSAPAGWQGQAGQPPYGAPPVAPQNHAGPNHAPNGAQPASPYPPQAPFPPQTYAGQEGNPLGQNPLGQNPHAQPPLGAPGMNAAAPPFGRPGPAGYGQMPQPQMAPGQMAPGQMAPGQMAPGQMAAGAGMARGPSFAPPGADSASMIATPGFPGMGDRGPVNPGGMYAAGANPAQSPLPAGAYRGQNPAHGQAPGAQAYPGAPMPQGYAAGPQGYAAGPQGYAPAPQENRAPRGANQPRSYYPIDRRRLAEQGMLGTESASPGQVEEFRIVKRQIIEQADDMRRRGGGGAAQRVLICSAHPGEGKTFCAVNLAMSISAEKESEVLLVDFDIARAAVLEMLGLPPGPGLMEAIVDPTVDVRKLVMATDIPGLSVLPGGRPTNSDTEYLASSRAAQVLDMLTEDAPQRIVLFDSPPALTSSISAELAKLMGQVVMVVLADSTPSGAVQDAASLLAGCPNVQLLLNSVQFSPNGRRFGSYHGYRG